MANPTLHKVGALPSTPQADALYFLESGMEDGTATGEIHVTRQDGTPVRVGDGRRRHGDHPLALHLATINSETGRHFWHGPGVYDTHRNRHCVFVSEGYKHGHSPRGGLFMMWSEDGFTTPPHIEEVDATGSLELSSQFGAAIAYPNGRIGIAVYCYDDGAHQVRWYVSDDGATWSYSTITLPTGPIVLGGEFYDLPNGDKIAYGYGGTPPAPKWCTVSAGDSAPVFNSGDCLPTPPTSGVSEPRVAKIADDKWVMYARDDRSTASQAYDALAMTSTDGKSFTAPVASGMLVGSNPVVALAMDDRVHLYAIARGDYIGGAGDAEQADGFGAPMGHRNQLVRNDAHAETLFADGGVFPTDNRTWSVERDLPRRSTGQLQTWVDVWGRRWAILSAKERLIENGDPPCEQSNYILSPNAPPIDLSRRPAFNLLHNPRFNNRGFIANVAMTTTGLILDRWRLIPNGASFNVQYPPVNDTYTRLLPFGQSHCVSIASSGAPFAALEQTHLGADFMEMVSEQTATIQLLVSGFIPDNLFLQIRFDFDNGDPIEQKTRPLLGDPPGFGIFNLNADFLFPSCDGKVLGPNPKVTLSFKSGDSGSLGWGLTIYQGQLSLGTDFPAFSPFDLCGHLPVLDAYREVITYPEYAGINIGLAPGPVVQIPMSWGEKIGSVTPQIENYTAGDLEVASTGSAYAIDTVDFSSQHDRGAYMNLRNASIPSGAFYLARVTGGNQAKLVVATGY